MPFNFSTTQLLHAIRQIPASVITSQEKYLLTIILSCMNTDNKTWHSIESLAEFACMAVRTLYRHIKNIEQKGFIHIQRPEHNTHHVTNIYSLNIEQIMAYSVDKSRVKMTVDNDIACQNDTRYPKSHVKMTVKTQSRMSKWHTKKESFKEEIKEKKEPIIFEQPKSKATDQNDTRLDDEAQRLSNIANVRAIISQLTGKKTFNPKEGGFPHAVLEAERKVPDMVRPG